MSKQMARACFARRELTQLGFTLKRGGSVVGVRGGHAPSGSQCPSPLLIPAKAIPTRGNRRRSQQYGDAWAVARSEAPIQQGKLFSTLYPLLASAPGALV